MRARHLSLNLTVSCVHQHKTEDYSGLKSPSAALCRAEYTHCSAGMCHRGRSFGLGRGLVFGRN